MTRHAIQDAICICLTLTHSPPSPDHCYPAPALGICKSVCGKPQGQSPPLPPQLSSSDCSSTCRLCSAQRSCSGLHCSCGARARLHLASRQAPNTRGKLSDGPGIAQNHRSKEERMIARQNLQVRTPRSSLSMCNASHVASLVDGIREIRAGWSR